MILRHESWSILFYWPARADVRVEGGDGKDAEAVERLLRRLRHLRQDALKRKQIVFMDLSMFPTVTDIVVSFS